MSEFVFNWFDHRVMAFDPGGTTGIATWIPTDVVERWYLGPNEHHLQLEKAIQHFDPHVIVTERFDYRPHQGHADLDPVEYIGVMKLHCQKYDVPLIQQKQLKGHRGLWTDDKLKAMGLYIPGEHYSHAMDATRQLLFYMTNEGYQGWVDRYGEAIGKDVDNV